MDENISITAILEGDHSISKQELMKAIAAAIRWRAAYKEDHEGDDQHLTTLAQILHKLIEYDG